VYVRETESDSFEDDHSLPEFSLLAEYPPGSYPYDGQESSLVGAVEQDQEAASFEGELGPTMIMLLSAFAPSSTVCHTNPGL